MNNYETKTVRVEVNGRVRHQFTLDQPVTLAEVWRLPQITPFGPHRMARLGVDGVAYVSIDSVSYEAWRLATELEAS